MKIHIASLFSVLLAGASLPGSSQTVLWNTSLPGNSAFVIASDERTVYAVGSHPSWNAMRTLNALDMGGTIKWTWFGANVGSAAIADDGTVYAVGDSLTALSPDGGEKWHLQVPDGRCNALALGFDGTVYCVFNRMWNASESWRTKMYALSPNGATRWSFSATNEFIGVCVNVDGTVYVHGATHLRALNPDGTFYWQIGGGYYTAVQIDDDGTLYVSRWEVDKPVAVAVDPTGFERWITKNSGGVRAITPDGLLCTWPNFSKLSKDGYPLWTGTAGADVFAVTTEGILGASGNPAAGPFYLAHLSRAGGEFWRTSVGSGGGILTEDGRFFTSAGSAVMALRLDCVAGNSAWPMWGHDSRRTFRAGPGKPGRPLLRPLRMANGRGFQMSLIGEPGESYAVEYTENLRDWQTLQRVQGTNWPVPITDPAGANAFSRSYRAAR